MKELNQRAFVALTHLVEAGTLAHPWLPGMLGATDAIKVGGDRRVMAVNAKGITHWCDANGGDRMEGDGWNREELDEEWKDVAPRCDDLLTGLALVALARIVWKDPVAYTIPRSWSNPNPTAPGFLSGWVWAFRTRWAGDAFEGASEVEAAIVALEAARRLT